MRGRHRWPRHRAATHAVIGAVIRLAKRVAAVDRAMALPYALSYALSWASLNAWPPSLAAVAIGDAIEPTERQKLRDGATARAVIGLAKRVAAVVGRAMAPPYTLS